MLHENLPLGAVGVLIAGLTGGLATGLAAQANPFTDVPDVRAGQQLFDRQCSVCHGEGAAGGEVGPDLTTGDFRRASTDAGLFNVISEGIPNTAMMGINAVKGVEIGDGFAVVEQKGTEHRDELTPSGFVSNSAGGILGGISSGQDIVVSIALKPTSSIRISGDTVDVRGINPT